MDNGNLLVEGNLVIKNVTNTSGGVVPVTVGEFNQNGGLKWVTRDG